MDTRASTVDGVLTRSARRTPDRVALHFADRTWTYRELDDAVTRAAGFLGELGIAGGDRVATYGRNSDAYALAFLGCARIGAVHVPINYALTGEELGYQSGSRAAGCCCSTRRWPGPSTRCPSSPSRWCRCATRPARCWSGPAAARCPS